MPIGIDMNNYDISMGTGQIRMSGGGTFTSDNSINYDWISRASAADYDWTNVCFGNGLFVAVSHSNGSNNSVMTSPDGINWTLRTTPSPGSSWRSVAFGTPTSNPNGLFVAVADSGTSRVMTSTNGISWTARDVSSNTNGWVSVAYGSGYFVAGAYGGNSNRIMYSSNGINWTDVTINSTFTPHGITFGNGRFVVVPVGSNNTAYYTTNNLSIGPPSTWVQSNNINALRWINVAYGNGLFVAVSEGRINLVDTVGTGGQQLTSHVMTSPDGITWTNRYSPDIAWLGITYGAGMFVAVASRGVGNRVMTSPDGINWTLRPSANDSLIWYGIAYGNGIFVALSWGGGTGNRVMTLDPAYGMSINKITTEETTTNLVKFGQNGATISANPSKNFAWVARSAAENNSWRGVCYGNSLFVAVAESGTNRVMTSSDGYNWVARTAGGVNSWITVCYGELSGNNVYVAVATTGTNRSLYSTNGTSWTAYATPNDDSMGWVSVAFGYDTSSNGIFVATASSGTAGLGRVMTSSNGINWTQRNASNNTLGWRGVCYGYDSSGQGQFVAVAITGTGNRSMYSIDGGFTWVGKQTTNDTTPWRGICYGNGTFVAVADAGTAGGRVMYSRNIIGAGWSNANYPVENEWWSVSFGDGLFVAVANSGTGNRVMTSPDGINWTIRTSVADNNWKSVCYGNGTFVAVSGEGTNRVMTNDYTANDNMLVLNGGISPTTGQLNVKSRLYVAPDGLYNMSPTWATTIMANTEGKVVLSTAPNGGVTAPDGFQANAPFAIFDKFYGTYGVGLKMGIFRDTGAAYIQCENANTGARNICLQSYAGDVGIGTTSPVAKLDVAGSALIRDNLQLGTNANDYSLLTMGGGNTYGYMYANFTALGDGIHMGYNAYNVNGTWVRPGTGMGSGTSRISMGYGYIGLYTSGESNTNPPNNLGLYQNSGGQVGIGTTSPAYTLDVSGGPIRAHGNYYSGAVSNVTNFLTGVFIETNSGIGAVSDGKTFMGLKSLSGGGGAGFVFTRGLGYQTALQVYTNTDASQLNGSLNTGGPYVASGGTSWASASDERLKDNITELNDNTLDNVCNIRAVEYTWKSHPMSKKCIGFIAQNVQEYYPEVVETNPGDGYLGIEYTSMIPVLLKSIQQLKSKLDDTKQTLDDALQRIQILESK